MPKIPAPNILYGIIGDKCTYITSSNSHYYCGNKIDHPNEYEECDNHLNQRKQALIHELALINKYLNTQK